MSETPEQKYFRNSRGKEIPLAEELSYWTARVVAGFKTERMAIDMADIPQGTEFDCMKVLELFCNYAEEKANGEREEGTRVLRREQDALQQGAD
jgi:hypothetical protein